MSSEQLTCEGCLQKVRWRTEVEGEWLGPCCVPEQVWKRYPGWRERETLSQQRSEKAKQLHAEGKL